MNLFILSRCFQKTKTEEVLGVRIPLSNYLFTENVTVLQNTFMNIKYSWCQFELFFFNWVGSSIYDALTILNNQACR